MANSGSKRISWPISTRLPRAHPERPRMSFGRSVPPFGGQPPRRRRDLLSADGARATIVGTLPVRGGIRSAAFALGVVQALAAKGVLPLRLSVDGIGGGYLARSAKMDRRGEGRHPEEQAVEGACEAA